MERGCTPRPINLPLSSDTKTVSWRVLMKKCTTLSCILCFNAINVLFIFYVKFKEHTRTEVRITHC